MHVLIAPESFGEPLGARAAGASLAAGWSRGAPHDSVEVCPLSDGGRGFTDLVAGILGAAAGPDGVLLVPGTHRTSTAYVDAFRPVETGRPDHGLAARVERALHAGATRVVVGLPAPHEVAGAPDAGAGLLAALGVLAPGASIGTATAADLQGLTVLRDRLRGVDLVGATASDVPLLGLHGASASAAAAGTLGAQEAHDLERSIGHFAHVARGVVASTGDARRPLAMAGTAGGVARSDEARALTGGPGTGAGGGLGFALRVLGGRLVAGADLFAAVARTTERAERADLVVTARGALDGASFHGSALATAVAAAAASGVPCVAVARTSMMSRREQAAAGLNALVTLAEPSSPRGESASVELELARCAERLARTWSPTRVLGHT